MSIAGRGGLGTLALGAALLAALSSCAESEAGPSVSTVSIQPTSYVVKDPVTTTTGPPTSLAEGRSPVEQTFTIQTSNDVPINIATLYDVDLDELRTYNGWEEGTYAGFPGIGGTVKIPPGAKIVDLSSTTTTAAPEPDDTTTEGTSETGDSTAPATGSSLAVGDCAPGSYVVEDGDAPLLVARKFDTTLEALDEANVNTPRWPNLYTGDTIVIPPPSDCP